MNAQRGKPVRMARGQRRRGSCMSAKALYARPLALRQLYADAGSVIRRGQREAAAAHRENSR
ncbi:hypothetical protein [Haloechinothrix sp. LS1_15]|uniref:hypothetical protein n=1 Tax=Haloechinothrix sp. LS1_15 TaxID=2652248 RepID=UPI00294496DD|nr:hypothetical protein [Haloechinothrix sp. LS1_15]